MTPNQFIIPAPVGRLCALLPAYPGWVLFASALNLVVSRNLPDDVKQALTGRRLRITATDANLSFTVEWRAGGFRACAPGAMPELTISASAQDFLLLARRQEDPDTLFFSRRLGMEGDTELGLLVKNTLDAIEVPVFELGRTALGRVFGRFGGKR
ncbi:sterol-binding protein [Noviherbaspirillum sp. 17J57-3]|uniref:Ubiquinone biosynthesis accessory factor UbiT n=2 Tax=Noviherbaspirillum galbum TaxID=2709383 RepID=A0A6B3SSE1_9BURK|nr:sterol-binding protein [Noviherbaspirillum galbum]